MKKAIVVCLETMILMITGVANAEISVYTSESTFLANANVVSTETFDEYPSDTMIGTGPMVIDGITYIGDIPTTQWWTSDSFVYPSRPNGLYGTKPNLDGAVEMLTFGDGRYAECIGFYLCGPGGERYPEWEVIATTTDGKRLSTVIWSNESSKRYRGFIASQGIVSVSITDIPNSRGSRWDFDNVSHGEIVAEPAIIYVDADANGADDGSSWADAFNYLQDAFAGAGTDPNIEEIWVAEGFYTPDSNSVYPDGTGDRTATFQLLNGVALYGGFSSYGDPNWEDRDPNTYETILSGDLDGDDGPNFANNGENSLHVVTGSGTDETTVLNGFTITGGNAYGSYPNNRGGGMYNDSGSTMVANCIFSGNFAVSSGGGMSNTDNSSPVLVNCTFSRNKAYMYGGGVYNYQSEPNLATCKFIENRAAYGGGLCNSSYSSPTVTKCSFSGNSADRGGGMYNRLFSNPTLTNCTFSENSGHWDGGGMYNYRSNPTLTNCQFSQNWASFFYGDGGGMYNFDSRPMLVNCVFTKNRASDGGGMSNDLGGPTLVNCTFSGNSVRLQTGGISNYFSNLTVTNCILWGDTAREIYGGPPVITYSDVQGGWPGLGNSDTDPLFVSGPLGDFYLSQVAAGQLVDSPCVNAGSDLSSVFGLDQLTTRTDHVGDAGIVDMGYHYAPPANTVPVACIVGGDRTVEAEADCRARVTLDGSCSSDADSTPGANDDIVYFDWYEQIDPCDPNGEVFLGTGEIIDCNLPLGEHTIILEVIDKAGVFDANEVTIIVEDTTSPEITCPADVTVEQESYAGTVVALEAAATDNCDANPAITSDELAIYPLGVTMVTFTATDASGNSASCSMTVTVVDTIPPEFTLSISPDVLWPANHKMVDITLTVTVGDICDPNPNVVLTSVVSNEPDDAPGGGDGQTSNDIQDAEIGTEDYNISLRAERQGKGNGRIYTITCTATDASGNSSSTSTTVTVPHDKD